MKRNDENKLTADQQFAEDIVKMLEAGTTPWQREWSLNEALALPAHNLMSKAEYKGANVVRLFLTSQHRGYTDPRWMTYKQAQEAGMQVRKGEKGTAISFFKHYKGEQENAESGETETVNRFAKRTYTVFNAEQIDGVEPLPEPESFEWDPLAIGEKILAGSHAKISHDGGNRAFYRPATDSIHLPDRTLFHDAAGFYSTAIHELAHWTGHESRLNRKYDSFGSEDYAREELRAEIASWMIAVATGLPFNPDNHAAYVKGWIKALRNDYREIFRACADAEKIKDYLLELAQPLEKCA